MKTILHISADFPDPIAPAKTKAVQWLLEAAPGFRHIVYSLNRASWRSGVVSVPFGDGHCALAYGAPPYGVGMAPRLSRLADFILADLEKRRLVPDLVHAHKFTVEGLIADRIGNKAQVPFIASLWGGTDCRIYTAKPNLRPAYRRIAHSAAALLPAAPWTASYFAEAFAMDTSA
ncbi:MAG: glycosyltransferase family 4 protein, partial [Rhodomicrobium sp.]|nr:glycosyltransferase family 4 protein [Rhodomicrobium sp.]